MRVFNTPAQARSLRDIEAAAMKPATKHIKEVNANTQEGPETEATTPTATQEEGQAEETKTTTKKSRSKKNTEAV